MVPRQVPRFSAASDRRKKSSHHVVDCVRSPGTSVAQIHQDPHPHGCAVSFWEEVFERLEVKPCQHTQRGAIATAMFIARSTWYVFISYTRRFRRVGLTPALAPRMPVMAEHVSWTDTKAILLLYCQAGRKIGGDTLRWRTFLS